MVNGIPHNEMRDRGKLVSAKAPYIPYTAMTKGEFQLALLHNEADVYAQAYPDYKEYREIANMYRNALGKGIAGGIQFTGALHSPNFQTAAANIVAASKNKQVLQPFMLRRNSIGTGIHIGDEPIYTGSFDHDCVQYATKASNARFRISKSWTWWKNSPYGFGPNETQRNYWKQMKAMCETKVAIEGIMNENMVGASHHLLYKDISDSFHPIVGSQVLTKKTLHSAGIGGLANVSELGYGLMSSWSEAAVIRANAAGGVGTYGSIESSLAIAPNAEKIVAEYNAFLAKYPNKNPKYDKIGSVIAVLTAVTALVTAISASIASAAKFQQQLNAKKQGALSAVQGYGTPALEAKGTDYLTPGANPAASSDNLILIGLGVGAFILSQND